MAPGGGRKRASKREKASATRGDVVQEAAHAGSGSQKKENTSEMVAEAGPRVRLIGSGQGVEGMAAVEATRSKWQLARAHAVAWELTGVRLGRASALHTRIALSRAGAEGALRQYWQSKAHIRRWRRGKHRA